MHLVGRYEKLRGLGPSGELTAPYILDRKRPALSPFACDEWWKSPDGIWIPTVAGSALGFQGRRTEPTQGFGPLNITTGTPTTFSLNSAYTAGSAGQAVALRYICPSSETLTSIYFNISAYGGTAANTNDINYEVRTGTRTGPTTTAGGLVTGGNGTKDPASATGWIAVSSLSVSLSAGYVWVIIADADGGGTDFATLNERYATPIGALVAQACADSANGFSTTTIRSAAPILVVGFSTGAAAGVPFASAPQSTSDTNRRGLYLGGVLNSLLVYGWVSGTGNANISGIELYDSSTNPGGSTLASSTTLLDQAGTIAGALLTSSYTLAASTAYRLVFTYGAAATRPNEWTIGTGSDSVLKSAMLGGGSWYYARANGTTNWSNDSTSVYPDMYVLIDDQAAPAASGGVMRANMAGGML